MTKINKKNKIILAIIIFALLVVIIASVCVAIFLKDDSSKENPSDGTNNGGITDDDGKLDQMSLFDKPISTDSKIGISYCVVGTTSRNLPSCDNEGLTRYPVYGQTLKKSSDESDDDFTALKQALLSENAYLNADPNATLTGDKANFNYDTLDKNGYLYLNGNAVLDSEGNHRQLYKHSSSVGMYFGDVSDDEVAVIKQIKIQPRQMGNYITGLYAPAGEVIKLTISKSDLDNIQSFYVYIGATLANGQANNIWLARDFNRMPVIANRMPVDKDVCTYDATTKTYTCYFGSYLGGPIYIGSPVNKTEFEVEISGGVEYPHLIYGLTTEEEYNRLKESSAPYFDLEVFDNTIRFSGPRLYADKYSYEELCQSAQLWDKIARVSKQVPSASNAQYGIDFLFEPFVAAGAAVAFPGRNTVNCPTDWMDGCLNVENFTINGSWGNIHEFNHHFQSFGMPDGGEVTNNAISLVEYSLFTKISSARSLNDNSLSGWNVYTDPSRVMRILLENSSSGNPVRSLDAYATVLHSFGQDVFIKATQNGSGADNWFKNLCDLTHYDFYYYFTEILHQPISESVANEVAKKGYPVYIPVASIYQTGTKYSYSGTTRQITTVQPFEFTSESYDFNVKSLIQIPDGFTITNVTVGNPQYGTIIPLGEDAYRFTPGDVSVSGDIDVTISISKDDNAFDVDDVTLVFGFKKQQPRIASRTTFYFDNDLLSTFSDVDDAIKNNYAGYTSSASFDSTFNGSECAAVWWNSDGVKLNSITEYNSKIYISEDNTYRFSIRGKYSNLYISLDGINYELVAKAGKDYNNKFSVCVENGEYIDYSLKKGDVVYIKAVVMHVDVNSCAFVVGMGVVADNDASLDDLTKKTTVYNLNYQKEAFESNYFYSREYSVDRFALETNQTSKVISTNFSAWDDSTILDNLFDGKSTTFMHNKQGEYVRESSPFEMVVDLNKIIKADTITMYGRSYNTQTPMSYKLYGGLSLDDMSLLCEYTDEPLKNGCNQVGKFPLSEIRYYKLIVTKTNANYICLSGIEFSVGFDGGKLLSPDIADYYGQWELSYDLPLFGHSYTTQNGYLEFEFVGSQIAIISDIGNHSKFVVTIDDKEYICEFDGQSDLMFLSDELSLGTHKITIKSLSSIDIHAFAIKQ